MMNQVSSFQPNAAHIVNNFSFFWILSLSRCSLFVHSVNNNTSRSFIIYNPFLLGEGTPQGLAFCFSYFTSSDCLNQEWQRKTAW
jgi:hypothetical protein